MQARAPSAALALALLITGCGRGADLAASSTTTAPEPPPTSASVATPGAEAAPSPSMTSATAVPTGPVRFASPYAKLATATALASDLAEAEAIVRDVTKPPADRARAGRRQQIRLRQLGDTPTWDDEVLAAMPLAYRESVRRNVEGGRMLLSMFKVFPADLPPWEIVDPAPPEELLRYYREAEAAIGVEWTYLASINFVETKMGRIRGFSTAGARGPMQFIPSSWKAFGAGGDIDDNRDSIFAAARHLVSSGGKPFNIDKALYGYNHSDKYVTAVKDFADVMRAEPETYVGYHAWETFYRTRLGDQLLPKGYKEAEKVPMAEYAKRPVVTISP